MSNLHFISLDISLFEGLKLYINPLIIGLIFCLFIIPIFLSFFKKNFSFFEKEVKLKFLNIIEVNVKPNYETKKIAYQVWVEINTRKAALPFDKENDVIIEIYDSWYTLFKTIRELIKNIPVHRIKTDKDIEKLVSFLIRVLNEGLRPHLTKWQAKFRHWIENQSNKGLSLSPQELQKKFPDYGDLIFDLERINSELQKISDNLYEIVLK